MQVIKTYLLLSWLIHYNYFFFNVGDTGRLHLVKQSQGYQTKVEVQETGTYKLFVSITTIVNDTLCRQSTDNYIRVVLEHPNGGSVILMEKEWGCPKDLLMGEDRVQPIELGDTFKLTKGSNVFLQVKDRCQIYAFRTSNQFGYMKMWPILWEKWMWYFWYRALNILWLFIFIYLLTLFVLNLVRLYISLKQAAAGK